MQFPSSIPPHWLRRARWFVGGVLVLWLLAWLAVPPLVKQLIEEKATAAVGRAVTVGAVAFSPWSLELTVSNLSVATADGKAKQLELARVYVDAELESLVRFAPVLDAITVDAPTGQLTHLGDGRYDVDDILEHLAQTPASDAPLRFALYNLTLNGGSVDFYDHTAFGVRQHSVRSLLLAVPFLSTLESKRKVKVVPRLAFTLNGSSFDTAAEGTPFANTQQGQASLKISKLDLAPYLPYLPSSLPVRLQSAVVDADLRVAFEQAKQQKLALSGMLTVSGLAVGDAAGAQLLAVESVVAELADVRPLERLVKLKSLEVNAPSLQATRNRAGRINLAMEPGVDKPNANTTKTIADKSTSTGAIGLKGSKPSGTNAAPKPWSLALERLTVRSGAVAWTDDSTQPQARLSVADLALSARGLQWPLTATPASFDGSASVPLKGKKTAQLTIKGELAELFASANVNLVDVELGLAAPYVTQALHPNVQGVLDAALDARWEAGVPVERPGDKPSEKPADTLKVGATKLTVRDFAMKLPKAPVATTNAERAAAALPNFKLLEITGAQLDVFAKTGSIDKVALQSPEATVHRDAQGQWMFQRWLKTTAATPATALNGTTEGANAEQSNAGQVQPTTDASSPWQIRMAELGIQDGTIKLDDRNLARPARLEVSALKLQLRNATQDGSKPAPLTLSARVKSGRAEPGTIDYKGTVMWAPLEVKGRVDAVHLPVHAAAPYLADQLNLSILRADASFKGEVRFAQTATGPEVNVQGDASVEDFRANTIAGTATAGTPTAESPDLGVTEELLSWKSLAVPGITLAMAPGAATRLQVRQASLSEFFARVIVNPNGRINLQDMVKSPPPAGPASAVASAPATAVASAAAETRALEPVINMGPINLVNGKVLFSDRFIRPNYSANLSELQGTLSQFASQAADGSVQMADLDVLGRAEGTAALEITGKVNPLAKPLALDINGKVRDLDLPPLTAYSIKYAGYGIERGKLSMDVNYTVLPNGQLTASNKLVLNQLTFGDEVKGAPNSLPVKLAVALLADSNGVIDIDLPISGSLNDPQFSFGSLVFKVIANLVGKALTAPFSLIASAIGGGASADELSNVAFAPGSSVLSPAAMQGLDQVAKALIARPKLSVTVVGTATLDQERDALKRELLKAQLLTEKRRRAAVTGTGAAATATLTETEFPVLLAQVYRRADITKPRNVVGLAKDLPVPEMEALLLASIPVQEDAIRQLALQRGVVVKDYLATRQLAVERLFVGAPKIANSDATWKPRAELSVSQR